MTARIFAFKKHSLSKDKIFNIETVCLPLTAADMVLSDIEKVMLSELEDSDVSFSFSPEKFNHSPYYGYILDNGESRLLVCDADALNTANLSILELLDFLDIPYDGCVWVK